MSRVLSLQSFKNSALFYFLLSGLTLGWGFIFPALWFVGFFGVGFFILAVSKAERLSLVWWGGVVAWTIKSLLAVSWFWTTYPIRWIDLGLGTAELPVIGFYWLTVSFFLGLAGGFLALTLFFLRKRLTYINWILLVPPLWVLSEILSALSMALCTFGVGGTVNIVFSFGSFGYLLAEHVWLLELSRLGGVYSLTFFGVTLALILWQFFYVKKSLVMAALALVIVVVTGQLREVAPEEKTNPSATVAIIDTTFGGEEFFARPDRLVYKVEQQKEALAAALATGATYVVMSEDSRIVDVTKSPTESLLEIQSQLIGSSVVVEVGTVPQLYGAQTLRASLYDLANSEVYAVDKQYLVPQGEYVPYFYMATLRLVGAGESLSRLSKKIPYKPGPLVSQSYFPDDIPGILFCFASAEPLAVFNLVKDRNVPFIAHPVSHAWFNEPELMWHQFDSMLKIHAVFNQVPIVSAGNMVTGALYQTDGSKDFGRVVAKGANWQVSLVSW